MAFSIFNRKKNKSIAGYLISEIGFDDTSIFFYTMVSSKFNGNSTISFKEHIQFIREELDAASQGNEYAKKFTNNLEPNSQWYRGALNEEPQYPIDGENGPQQTLLGLILPYIQEDAEQAIKLRCSIVKLIFDDMVALSQDRYDPDCLFSVDFYMENYAPDYEEIRKRIPNIVNNALKLLKQY